jgi:hypothetical protein
MVTREPPEQCLFCSGGTSVEEHLLVSIVSNILPFSRSIEKESFRDAHTAGGLRLMSQAVQFRSVKRYSADWNRWLAFMRQWMDSLEPREDDVFLLDVPLRAQVATLAAFMHFQFVDLHLRASTIISGMSGVRHQFRSNLLPVEIFSNQSLSACKNALTLEERKLEGLSAVQRRHPLTGDMLTWIGGQCVATGLVVDNMVGVGIVLAFYCLLRTSEYVPDRRSVKENSCHALRAADVLFELTDAVGQRSMVESFLVSADMWPRVTLVKFILRSAKNDKYRIGSTFWYRNEPQAAGQNVVRMVFLWALRANHAPTDFLLSCRATSAAPSVWLTYDQVAQLIKSCARAMGLNPNNYGTYSARVGGACTLRAGGASDSMIQMMGRWKSMSSCLTYQESSQREYDQAQRILRDTSVFTANDVRLIHVKDVSKTVKK